MSKIECEAKVVEMCQTIEEGRSQFSDIQCREEIAGNKTAV